LGSDGLVFLPLTGGHRAATEIEQGAFLGLRLDHNRVDMARAVLEGVAYEVRWALEQIRGADIPVHVLWMIGGATRSPLWPQIIADVTHLPVTLPASKDWPAVGAAILAGVGVGVFDSLENGQRRFRGERQHIAPDPAHAPIYDQHFARYQQIAQRTHAILN
jgi:xylulokinase